MLEEMANENDILKAEKEIHRQATLGRFFMLAARLSFLFPMGAWAVVTDTGTPMWFLGLFAFYILVEGAIHLVPRLAHSSLST